MRITIDRVVTAALVLCALITTGAVVRRNFFNSSPARAQIQQKTTFIEDWKTYLKTGERMGSSDARVNLVEFADFECPFCGSFRKTLKSVEDKNPGKIAVTYVHFPIQGHRFAMPAARAAECANDQEHFKAMHDALFEEQDQFGLKPWEDYAKAAGVLDLTAFDICIKKTDPIPRVEEGKALGNKLNVQGTPTIIINGWKLGNPPTETELDQMVKRILAGKSPVDGKS